MVNGWAAQDYLQEQRVKTEGDPQSEGNQQSGEDLQRVSVLKSIAAVAHWKSL